MPHDDTWRQLEGNMADGKDKRRTAGDDCIYAVMILASSVRSHVCIYVCGM